MLVVGSLGAIVLLLVLLGVKYPGSGADVLDWKPTRSPELDVELELTDVAQMLEAQNERRRARGAPELTEEDFERRVREDRLLRERLRAAREQRDR